MDDIVQRNETRIYQLEQKIQEQNNRLDGLTTVLEGINAKLSELSATEQNGSMSDQSKLLKELAAMIDEIDKNYVKKDEFHKALKSSEKNSKSVMNLNSFNEKESFERAVSLYRDMHYKDSKALFEKVDKKGYKSAESNYYLGEIAYYTKEYKDAIFYYKKSVGIDDDTSYMDTLLLHTGISLENTDDKSQAKLFMRRLLPNIPINIVQVSLKRSFKDFSI